MMVNSKFKIEIPFYLMIAVAFSFLLSLFLLQLFAGLLVILYLFESFENKKKAFDVFGIAILIFGIVRILAIAFSEYPSLSVQSFYKEALFYLGFFAFNFYLKVFDDKKFFTIIKSFAIAAVIIALIGVVRFNLGNIERAESFSSGYATFSSYLLAVLGVQLFLFNKEKPDKKNILWLLASVIILCGIITSLGRTNIAAAVLITLVFFIIKRLNFRYIAVMLILTAGLSWISFMNNTFLVSERIESPSQLSDRNIIYEGAEEILFDHPVLGFGPRTFHKIFPEKLKKKFADPGIGSWHNDFLQIYFESGFLGELTFILLVIFPFIKGIKYLKTNGDERNKNIVMGAMFGIGGLILSALTAGFIDSPVLAVVFSFLISIISRQTIKTNTFIDGIAGKLKGDRGSL